MATALLGDVPEDGEACAACLGGAQVHATLAMAFATMAKTEVQKEGLAFARETAKLAQDIAAENRALMEDL